MTHLAVRPQRSLRLDFNHLDHPLRKTTFTSREALDDAVVELMRRDLLEARKGTESPVKVASHVIGAARAHIRTLARYGGIAGQSFRDHLSWFRGFAGSLASGPPAPRIQQLIALHRAGLLRFIGPDMRLVIGDTHFVVDSPAVPTTPLTGRSFLEAYLPGTSLARTADPLLRSLRDAGEIRRYVTPDQLRGDFTSGAVEVTPSTYHLVRADGSAHPRRLALGIPVEGEHWGTQLGAIARTNSRFLRETDAVAQAALNCVQSAAPAQASA